MDAIEGRDAARDVIMPGPRAQALRERSIACLLTGLCLCAVGTGVLLSPEGNRYLGVGFGLVGMALVCAFGIVWDMQYPPRPVGDAEARRRRRSMVWTVGLGLAFALVNIVNFAWPFH